MGQVRDFEHGRAPEAAQRNRRPSMARVPVQITTERLLTPTPLAPADIEAVHVVFCDQEVMRYAPWWRT
jgi:hypothetical protein